MMDDALRAGCLAAIFELHTQLFWAPNHATPGWWLAFLILLRAHGEIGLSTLRACCTPVIWPRLSVLGAVPLVAFLALRAPWRYALYAETLLAASTGLKFLPNALYLLIGADAVRLSW